MKPTNSFLKYLISPISVIFKLIQIEFKKLFFTWTSAQSNKNLGNQVKEGISPQDRISDFVEVFKPTRVFFIFNILAFVIFLLLPQGRDAILVVIEDLSEFHFSSLFSLLFGVTGWAIAAEFGARYKIYISDNSGKSLSGNRVSYRKQLQRFLSMVYLLLPFVAVFFGVSIVTFNNSDILVNGDWDWQLLWPYIFVILSILFTAANIAKFYFDAKLIKKLKKKNYGVVNFLKLPREELIWLNKLYGIYNDYVFSIRKETFFIDRHPKLKKSYEYFISLVEQARIKSKKGKNFPDDFILSDEKAPKEFRPTYYIEEYTTDFSNPENYRWVKNKAGSYRWVYRNNPKFYKVLHRQVRGIALGSLFLLLGISLIPSAWIGSPGLICLSFGCWQGVYSGLLYLDYRYRSSIFISARWLLAGWVIIVSFADGDHPVRYNEEGKKADNRPTLVSHFEKWMVGYGNDTNTITGVLNNAIILDNTRYGQRNGLQYSVYYPLVFITAEGGALRTGAFTAMLLAALQDSFPKFRNNIYAYSTVSGGSVGVSFFNAISYLEKDTAEKIDFSYYRKITRDFFTCDQLSPVLSKMFYADILNYLWPSSVQIFDRAIALEKEWERDYGTIFNKTSDKNVYSSDFMSFNNIDTILPAWFINTTEVESGLQCFISNVKSDGMMFSKERDLLAAKIRSGINYSTAVGFSTRFPLFSPSVAIKQNDLKTYHYVDGGYVENTGSKTMLEILQILQKSEFSKKVKPYVIQLKFGDKDEFQSTGFVNELSSIANGIYNTRSGNSKTYSSLLKKFTEETMHGSFISVPLEASTKEVPMSWVFSERSMKNLDSAISEIMHNKRNDLHKKLYLFKQDSTIYKVRDSFKRKVPPVKLNRAS